jgi:hypothetical protein
LSKVTDWIGCGAWILGYAWFVYGDVTDNDKMRESISSFILLSFSTSDGVKVHQPIKWQPLKNFLTGIFSSNDKLVHLAEVR